MRQSMILAAAAALCFSVAANAALKAGAKAPNFQTRGALGGKQFTLKLGDALKRGPVVLYFFPAAFTTGCTLETREFAEKIDDFRKAGATVIGMSADPIDKLARFSEEECRGKFPVATASPALINAYDVALEGKGITNRTSYVIAPDGRIAYVHSDMDYRQHVANTLAAVQRMKRPS